MSEKKVQKIMDSDNYEEVSRPFESTEEADKAVQAFWDDFYALRNKYRIADVYLCCRFIVKGAGPMMTTLYAGDEMQRESIAAWGFGRAQSDRQELIMSAIDQACKAVSRKSRQ